IEKFVKTILSVLEKNNFLARAELQSFDWRALLYAKKIYPKVKISFITQQDSEFDTFSNKNNFAWTAGYNIKDFNNSIPQMIAKLGGDIWCPNYRNIVENLELINLAHSYNIKVVPWTVDTPEEMIVLIDAGVDGIITNYAERLRGLLKVRNISLP
ncbi:MAG: hypothetical protein KBD64_04290, partial [Gammaproteobacteria bacterium]|nr:hypothetical protein [Gammaproteobacteria bacterium]